MKEPSPWRCRWGLPLRQEEVWGEHKNASLLYNNCLPRERQAGAVMNAVARAVMTGKSLPEREKHCCHQRSLNRHKRTDGFSPKCLSPSTNGPSPSTYGCALLQRTFTGTYRCTIHERTSNSHETLLTVHVRDACSIHERTSNSHERTSNSHERNSTLTERHSVLTK